MQCESFTLLFYFCMVQTLPFSKERIIRKKSFFSYISRRTCYFTYWWAYTMKNSFCPLAGGHRHMRSLNDESLRKMSREREK